MMILQNIVIFILCLICSFLIYFVPFLKERKNISFKDYFKNNKFLLTISIILFIGFISRTFLLDVFPVGLNQDEASSAYDAYSILHFGMDRNGNKLPVHLVAWGSGQNAFYSYLMIPFLLIFGNNEIAIRLPMGIIGCITLFLIYRIFNKQENKMLTIIALVYFIICPWHFMKSRWGLESNVFPDLVLFGVYFLMLGIKKDKIIYLIISSLIIGISSYSYGTSYFFLFFFIISTIVYLIIVKKIKVWKGIVYIGIIGLVCIPIIIFIFINVTGGESISFIGFTISKLTQNRFQAVTSVFSKNFFQDGFKNLKDGITLLITQNDGLIFNSSSLYGTLYLFSLPFTIIGIFKKYDEEKNIINILRIWIIVSILMMFIVSPNVNRINIIFIPLVIFTVLGIHFVVEKIDDIKYIIFGMYLISFSCFSIYYTNTLSKNLKRGFFESFGEAIRYADNIGRVDNYYVTSNVNMPYIFVLFYTQYNTETFVSSVNYSNPDGEFRYVNSFGNYNFYLPNHLENGNVYIVSYDNNPYSNVNLEEYKVTYFELYYVIDTTK